MRSIDDSFAMTLSHRDPLPIRRSFIQPRDPLPTRIFAPSPRHNSFLHNAALVGCLVSMGGLGLLMMELLAHAACT